MIKHILLLGLITTMPFVASTKPSKVIIQPLKNGYFKQTTLAPKQPLYTADVTQLESKLDQYRLIYGVGQIAHGIMYYSWNKTFPND